MKSLVSERFIQVPLKDNEMVISHHSLARLERKPEKELQIEDTIVDVGVYQRDAKYQWHNSYILKMYDDGTFELEDRWTEIAEYFKRNK